MFNELVFKPIFNLLLFLYSLVGDFGVAIIFFTIIVKIILFPLLKSQFQQSKRMQDIQPEIKKIKQQAKGNKQLEYIMTMNLYKQNNIKMSASLLSALIQLPIFITMLQAIRIIVLDTANSGQYIYDFLKKLQPIQDLIVNHGDFRPKLFGVIDLSIVPFRFELNISTFVLLLFVAGAALAQKYIMSSMSMHNMNNDKRKIRDILAEAGDGKQPDQSEINGIMMTKMNKFMPILIFVSLGSLYGVLGFYQFVSSVITILQRKLIYKKMTPHQVKTIDNHEVQEKLKKAKTAEIIMQAHQKKAAATKKKTKHKKT